MLVIKPLRLTGIFRPFAAARKQHLAATVIAPFRLAGGSDQGDSLGLEVELFRALARVADPATYDAGMPKPRGEVLAAAKAFAPSGKPATVCHVRLACGPVDKALSITGDRVLAAGGPSKPEPFTEMPIDWAHAFGGASFEKNPVGRGADVAGDVRRMPNVESDSHRMLVLGDKPQPQSFSAIPVTSPDRLKGLGTHDKKWLETQFPGPPEDFDWSMHNAAPMDQRIDDFFVGGEPYRLENLHPTRPIIEGTLPRCVGRTLVKLKGSDELRSLAMRLDTVLFVPHDEIVALVYRGTTEIASDDASDLATIVFALDHADAPRPLEHFERVVADRSDRKRAHLFALRDVDLVPEGMSGGDPLAKLVIGETREGLLEANMRRAAATDLAALRADLEAKGIDPDAHGVPRELPPPEAAPSFDELAVKVEQSEAELDALTARGDQMRAAAREAVRKAQTDAGRDPDEEEEKARAAQGGPPTFTARGEIERLLQKRGEPANTNVDEAMIDRLARAEAAMIDAYRRYAHVMPRPERDGAIARALLVSHLDADEPIRHKDLTGADLTALDLSGRDLDDAFFETARLDGTRLTGATCRRGVFARIEARGASFADVNLEGANLGESSLREVDFSRAVLDAATFHGARIANTTFEGASMRGVDWLDATFSGVDLGATDLSNGTFLRNDLRGVSFRGAKLDGASFIDCKLGGADFTGASLAAATFVNCDLEEAVLRGAGMENTRFVGETTCRRASFVEARIKRANFRGVGLEAADFSAATLESCDFSDADLRGARLFRAVCRASIFDRADLSVAICLSADLLGASFRSAKLLGTDLRDTNLFEADFFHAATDAKTDVYAAEISRAFLYDWRPG